GDLAQPPLLIGGGASAGGHDGQQRRQQGVGGPPRGPVVDGRTPGDVPRAGASDRGAVRAAHAPRRRRSGRRSVRSGGPAVSLWAGGGAAALPSPSRRDAGDPSPGAGAVPVARQRTRPRARRVPPRGAAGGVLSVAAGQRSTGRAAASP